RRALELARAMDDPSALAQSLNRLGNWYLNVDRTAESLDAHERALAIYGELGDRPGIAATLDLLAVAHLLGNDLLRSAEFYDQAIPILRELDNLPVLITCLAIQPMFAGDLLMDAVVPATDAAERIGRGELALRMARETGLRSTESQALRFIAA